MSDFEFNCISSPLIKWSPNNRGVFSFKESFKDAFSLERA